MNTIETLKAAKELIIKPEHWQKGHYTNDDRTCFCGLGAVAEVLGLVEAGVTWTVFDESDVPYWLDRAARHLNSNHSFDETFAVFNDADHTTHAEVLQAFDLAIKLVKDWEDVS